MTQWGVDTLFNPAKRHMDEEKRRLQSTRSEVGDNSGGKRIDLESGKVVIHKADDETDEAQTDEPATEAKTSRSRRSKAARGKPSAEKSEAPAETADSAAKELTPAQLRARERRGRS